MGCIGHVRSGVFRATEDVLGGDQLDAVEAAPQGTKFVRLTLNNISEEWQVFVQSILGRNKLPDWERVWVDLQQDEMRRDLVKSAISGSSSSGVEIEKEEENAALASKGQQEQRRRKEDISKIKVFRCGEMGHFSSQCCVRKKDKKK